MENVSEVTPSHVKLPHTDFSARGVLIRFKRWAGFLVSLKCKVFIYKTKKAFLTLHVYLIPSDPALEGVIICFHGTSVIAADQNFFLTFAANEVSL